MGSGRKLRSMRAVEVIDLDSDGETNGKSAVTTVKDASSDVVEVHAEAHTLLRDRIRKLTKKVDGLLESRNDMNASGRRRYKNQLQTTKPELENADKKELTADEAGACEDLSKEQQPVAKRSPDVCEVIVLDDQAESTNGVEMRNLKEIDDGKIRDEQANITAIDGVGFCKSGVGSLRNDVCDMIVVDNRTEATVSLGNCNLEEIHGERNAHVREEQITFTATNEIDMHKNQDSLRSNVEPGLSSQLLHRRMSPDAEENTTTMGSIVRCQNVYSEKEKTVDSVGLAVGVNEELKAVTSDATEKRDCEENETTDVDSEDEDEMADLLLKSLRVHLAETSNTCSTVDKPEQSCAIEPLQRKQRLAAALEVSWSPNTGLPLASNSMNQVATKLRKSMKHIEAGLEDGLLVPSRDPHKLNKLVKKKIPDTTGTKWFNMPAQTLTPELKKELQLLKLRGVLDPKHHYKREESKHLPKYFQIGTVVEGPGEFYSGRLTKKERKQTLADELLSDSNLKMYRKRKYMEIIEQNQAGGKKYLKQKDNRRKPSWAKS